MCSHRVLLTAIVVGGLFGVAAAEPVDYLREVKPILRERCFPCHGALQQQAGLRLDTGEFILQGGENGTAVMSGKPEESLLLERISDPDESSRMPPEGEPLSLDQIELIRRWIVQGVVSPEGEQAEPDPREHWAFQPPRRPTVPWDHGPRATDLGKHVASPLDSRASTRNPIDAFVEAELTRAGLTSRPPAPRHVLLRRVFLDLIGLPPTREQLQAFLADQSENAYEKVVDGLLNDPRHGERWGRHWMDVWRYSDWYGRRDANDVRNSAGQIFRWRDWIVRSLNEGQGYDRMVREMLAADEIAPEDYAAGVATGFLIRNYYSLNPNDWMRANVEHVGKAFLGLTFNCAHCHDHKYDPITHEDYFRLRAFFEPVYVRQDRIPNEAEPGKFLDYTYAGSRKVQRLGAVRIFDRAPEAPTWFYMGGDERNRIEDRGPILPGLPAFLNPKGLQIEPVSLPPVAWYPGLRTEIQEAILSDHRAAMEKAERELAAAISAESAPAGADVHDEHDGEDAPAPLKVEAAQAKLDAARAVLAGTQARINADRARYESCHDPAELIRIASRGEREAAVTQAKCDLLVRQLALQEAEAKPDEEAERDKSIKTARQGVTDAQAALAKAQAALVDDSLTESYSPLSPTYPPESTGRRRALAEWITDRDNPLTARVAVNHIWLRHFHSPLVESVHDFGRNGALPTHPELLDWLAVEFMESGWDMKHLHRLIVTSDTWRRASSVGDAAENVPRDPENRLLWRMNAGRMESEVVRDSLLFVGGQLDLTMGGVELENSQTMTTFRRSLYYSVYPERGGSSPLGELFDAPDPLDCYRRTNSIIPQQALALTNSDLVHQVSVAVVAAWGAEEPREADAPGEADRFIVGMFQRILSRDPTDAEQDLCREALTVQQQLAAESAADATTQARRSLVRVLLNYNDFITIR